MTTPTSFEARSLELLAELNTALGSSGSSTLFTAFTEITGTWSTNSTSYTQLGGASFDFSIDATAGDRILLYPPSASWSVYAYFRLKANSTHILLGDAAGGNERLTWGAYSGGSNASIYLGLLPIGNPLMYVAPTTETIEFSIDCKVSSGTLYLGRTIGAAMRGIGQFGGINLGAAA